MLAARQATRGYRSTRRSLSGRLAQTRARPVKYLVVKDLRPGRPTAESADSKSVQCGFESHPGYQQIVGAGQYGICMYPRTTIDLAMMLSAIGVLDRENAQICNVSVRAIRHWRRGDRRSSDGSGRQGAPNCPRCHDRFLDEAAYSYLLGLYLGDGHVVRTPRTYLLTIACADAWPGLVGEARRAMSLVMPSSSVFLRSRRGVACTYVSSVSKHWPCLFPQHGPGRKHERQIRLEAWQQVVVHDHTGEFARGLFHSDGCRAINRVRRPVIGGERWYEYPRYFFDNYSADILGLCGQSLDRLGIAWRFSRPTTISVARRDAVARLDTVVGPKY